MSRSKKVQTPRKVPYIGPRSRRLDEISGLVVSLYCVKFDSCQT